MRAVREALTCGVFLALAFHATYAQQISPFVGEAPEGTWSLTCQGQYLKELNGFVQASTATSGDQVPFWLTLWIKDRNYRGEASTTAVARAGGSLDAHGAGSGESSVVLYTTPPTGEWGYSCGPSHVEACRPGTLRWTTQVIPVATGTWNKPGVIHARGTLDFQGPVGSCTGRWEAGTPEAADLELWMFVEDEEPDPSWWGKEEGKLQAGYFGYPAKLWVAVREKRKTLRPHFADPSVSGAEVRLRYDGLEVGLAETDAAGIAVFEFPLPEDTPQGRSTHTLEVSAVRGAVRGSHQTAWQVQRGLQGIQVLVDPIEGTRPLGSTVTLSGRVFSVASGIFHDPVRARIVVGGQSKIPGAGEGSTDDRGYFTLPVKLADDIPGHERGTCLDVVAEPADADRYQRGEACAKIKISEHGRLEATILADKSLYEVSPAADPFADTVVISGRVTANPEGRYGVYTPTWAAEPKAALVVLKIDDRELASVVADGSGAYRYSFSPASVIPDDRPGAVHRVTAVAHTEGFMESYEGTVFLTAAERGASCAPGEVTVLEARGVSSVEHGGHYGYVHDGTRISQGGGIGTGTSTVTLAFALGGGAGVRVVVGIDTKLKIERYCQEASGRVQMRLVVDKPGNIVIDRSSDGASPNYEIEVVTPVMRISDLKTRYFVHVEPDGTTTVAVLDGSVSVSRPEGGDETDVIAGEQITIHAGETPERSRMLPLQ